MTAAFLILAVIVLLLAAVLAFVLVRGSRDLDHLLASQAHALEHATVRRREAEQRAGQAEAELLEARRELRESGYRVLQGHQVTVQTVDGRAIRCVLERVYADSYSLSHPTLIRAGQDAQALGGEILMPSEQVSLIQRFEAEAE